MPSAVWWHGFCRSCEAHNKRGLGTGAQPITALIRQARLAESSTVACMAIELVVAPAAGIAARSVALTSFGVDSGIGLFTAVVVVRQPPGRSERDAELDARDRRASRHRDPSGMSDMFPPSSITPMPE